MSYTPRFWRKLALLNKIEVTPGTDAEPAGAADAIQAIDVQFTPMEGGEESRDLLLPYFGHQGVALTGLHGRLEFSVEIAGAGAAGAVPKYGSLLRACGLSETVTVATDVVYEPVSAGQEASSIYYNRDGVRHALVYCRGNVTMEFVPQRYPRFRFTMVGLHGTVADTVLPAVTLSGFQKPIISSKANTVFSLHGYDGPTERVFIDLGNQVEPDLLINHEAVTISDRLSTGTVVMRGGLLADINWDQIAKAETKGPLALAHGSVAGNIVEVGGPKVQIGRYGEGESRGILNNSLPVMLTPDAGNDELVITVK